MSDPLREQLLERVGQPMGGRGPSHAPDPVNVPMIRHWVDAFDDRNPVYLDADAAVRAGFSGIVAPPAMLQTWTMARPRIEGLRERGGAADEIDPGTPLAVLTDAGFRATLATNSGLEFHRYLHVGEALVSTATLSDVSALKHTGLGAGYFVTWDNTYCTTDGEVVGVQHFRVFKYDPTRRVTDPPLRERSAEAATTSADEKVPGATLPPFDLDVTASVVVAGAIASRDFMPVHHDRDFAQAQGAPDIVMNIFSTNGYVARYATDWAGPTARLRRIAIRLGAPAIPGRVLRFTGAVTDQRVEGDLRPVEVTMRAENDLGPHATGTVDLTLPAT